MAIKKSGLGGLAFSGLAGRGHLNCSSWAGQPYCSFPGPLNHLATLTRNQVRFTGTQATVPMLTEPTSTQREAFHLLGTAIPLTLKQPEQHPASRGKTPG